jgi:hypothetical protein
VIESPVDDDRLKGGRAMRDDLARKTAENSLDGEGTRGADGSAAFSITSIRSPNTGTKLTTVAKATLGAAAVVAGGVAMRRMIGARPAWRAG